MNKRFNDLQLHQTDELLSPWQPLRSLARPSGGWVQAIRDALGMSAAALARRIHVSTAAISNFEKAEAEDAITLASLRKLADALDCDLRYALVPRSSLQKTLEARARQVASERLRPVAHSMRLEDQAVEGTMNQVQLDLLVAELLNGSRRKLW